ncbi:MAG: serine/threonine protein kinase [bacterium]|nr:serine/threonine protein kinase [bacterium]
MTENGSDRFDELLARALEVPTADQQAFVESNCPDPELREALIGLLGLEPKLGGFLERPAALGLGAEEPAVGARKGSSSTAQGLPDVIGPFRIREVLGAGGMGVVYLAEQDEPVQRELAVKVVRADLTAPGASERFSAERQALARLSHPAIAQMYEAGTTDDGFPYFAMELVSGHSIIEHCDRSRLSVEDRLELFTRVCDGVQHAHHRGIIHRDLKPSNILVAEQDGVPVPKIIDFGIAKALDRPLLGVTELTGERIIGTPAYMSPESLGIVDGSEEVDTRSDVYALGILLYELLSGTRPFETEGVSLAQILMRISQEEAELPSVKLRSEKTDAQDQAAQHRGVSNETLLRRLKGDLDLIVAKAIAHDRDERYNSPADLVSDIRRHLSNQPVIATPPSLRYLVGKLMRRHRGAVIAGVVVLLTLLLGIAGTSIGFLRARSEADRATREAAVATAVSGFVIDLFDLSDPSETRGSTITARELLDHGAEDVRGDFQDQPLARARFMLTIGEIYDKLGLYEEAEDLITDALEIRQQNQAADSLAVAEALNALGGVLVSQGRYDEALAACQQALEIQERRDGPVSESVARSLTGIGAAHNHQGHYQEAESVLQRAFAIREEILPPDDPSIGLSLNELALVYHDQGMHEEAEPLYRRSLTIWEKAYGPNHMEVAVGLNNLALLCDSEGRPEEAEALYRRSLEIYEEVLGPDHPNLARSFNNLALLYDRMGRFADAEPLFLRAVAINEASVGPDHPYVGICLNNLAVLYTHQERYPEAEQTFLRTLKIYESALGSDHPRYARTLFRYAEWHIEQDRLAEAESMLERAMAIQKEKLPVDHPKAVATREVYAELLRATGRGE